MISLSWHTAAMGRIKKLKPLEQYLANKPKAAGSEDLRGMISRMAKRQGVTDGDE